MGFGNTPQTEPTDAPKFSADGSAWKLEVDFEFTELKGGQNFVFEQ